jgi:hypothetical protein
MMMSKGWRSKRKDARAKEPEHVQVKYTMEKIKVSEKGNKLKSEYSIEVPQPLKFWTQAWGWIHTNINGPEEWIKDEDYEADPTSLSLAEIIAKECINVDPKEVVEYLTEKEPKTIGWHVEGEDV